MSLYDAAKASFTTTRAQGLNLLRSWGGFLKIISVGIPTYAGMKTGF